MTVEKIIFYLLVLDSVSCLIFVFVSPRWYTRHFRIISRLFPPGRGWAVYYVVLVAWIGWLTIWR